MKKLLFLIWLLVVVPCQANIITVDDDGPADFDNIQAAINLANEGDVVIVAEGVYKGTGNRDIDFKGKAITVQSTNPYDPVVVANTTIDCQGTSSQRYRGFYFHNNEGADSVLRGFTITNGYAPKIYLNGGYRTFGGGCYCVNSSPTIRECVFAQNQADWGGGIACLSSSCPVIRNSIIKNNVARLNGGGIYVYSGSNPSMINCTLVNNVSISYHAGAICGSSSSAAVSNCIIWGESSDQITFNGSLHVTYSNIRGGWSGEGNIDADPLFVDASLEDYHLSIDSPCINAGDPNYSFLPDKDEKDFDGDPRILINRVDMGVDEFSDNIPIIGISAHELVFFAYENGSNPDAQVLSVRNIGTSTLNWAIEEDCPWLGIDANSGVSTGEENEITVSIDTNDLAVSRYDCELKVSDPNALNRSKVITVTLHVGAVLEVPSDYNTIQEAIDDANDYDLVIVSEGTYTGLGNRDLDFHGKAITVRSVEPHDPNVVAATVIDCQGSSSEKHRGFYFHSGESDRSVVSGFTITNGYAPYVRRGYGDISLGGGIYCRGASPKIVNCIVTSNIAEREGGGIYNEKGKPTLINCTLSGNSASGSLGKGGGMYNYIVGNATLINCTFSGNSSTRDGGGVRNHWHSSPTFTNCSFIDNSSPQYGGGMSNSSSSNAVVTNCTFSGNFGGGGGGIHNMLSSPVITNCVFEWNSSYSGGGMYNRGKSPKVTNCLFQNNTSRNSGGGMYNYKDINALKVINCTFVGNTAGTSGGMYSVGNPTVANCIFWGNSDNGGIDERAQIDKSGSTPPVVNYCCIQGWTGTYGGLGNTGNNPLFEVDGYHLLLYSPCINAGDLTGNYSSQTDIDSEPRLFGGRVDMGADEFVPSMQVVMNFTPQALNLSSKGKWVKAHFVLPEGFAVEHVDPDSPARVIEPVDIESYCLDVFVNEDDLVEIEIVFDRTDFSDAETSDELVEIIVIGKLTTGQYFYGTDTIRIISNNLDYVAVLSSHWLDSGCGEPDWCSGLDLNHSSTVNFVDFAEFVGQ
ncbi:MAG: right-handed parallel beta-helix repeat-containing protein [Planctomycetota bacterium]|jgi:parallel beta-helix repeat protein